jgi:hypothetical protein
MIIKKSILPIFIILLVATGLRFYSFSEQAFTHDEFSTIFRLDFKNISDVIQIGMKEMDNHPIGTQVFYYYYTHVFGTSEMAVKFPILIFGIFAVYMVYLLGKNWFNSTAGIYSASFMAVLQYCVAQSQIARMYGFGILFVLLMVYFWDKLISNTFNYKNAIGFILAATVCSYTHYFSLLMVIIVGITGIFIVKKSGRIKYLFSGFLVFLLFVPHINILFYQLSKGGIEGWLGPFYLSYFFEYMSFVFHHSIFVGLLVVLPIILFFKSKLQLSEKKYRLYAIILFIAPMAIGFTYSYFVNNVAHERVLYFSFPFLLLFLSSFIKKQSFKTELILVSAILFIGSASLVFERNHYYLFNNDRYKLVAKSLVDWQNEIPDDKLLSIKFTHQKIDNYYNQKYNYTDAQTVYGDSISDISAFLQLLSSTEKEYLYFGRAEIVDQTYLQSALLFFPEIIKKKYTEAGEVYLLKRSNKPMAWPGVFFEYTNNFDMEKVSNTNADSIGNEYITDSEYIGTFEAIIDTLIFSRNNIIEVSAQLIQLDSIGGAKIVSSIEKHGKVVDWRGSEVDDFILNKSVYNTAMFSIPIPDIRIKNGELIKIFIWNPNKTYYKIKNFHIIVRPGNPYIYGGTRSIPWNTNAYFL